MSKPLTNPGFLLMLFPGEPQKCKVSTSTVIICQDFITHGRLWVFQEKNLTFSIPGVHSNLHVVGTRFEWTPKFHNTHLSLGQAEINEAALIVFFPDMTFKKHWPKNLTFLTAIPIHISGSVAVTGSNNFRNVNSKLQWGQTLGSRSDPSVHSLVWKTFPSLKKWPNRKLKIGQFSQYLLQFKLAWA